MPVRFKRSKQSTRSSRSFILREQGRDGNEAGVQPRRHLLPDIVAEFLLVQRRKTFHAIPTPMRDVVRLSFRDIGLFAFSMPFQASQSQHTLGQILKIEKTEMAKVN